MRKWPCSTCGAGLTRGVDPAAIPDLAEAAARVGARNVAYEPDESACGFVVDAPTTTHAFAAVGDVFNPLYGEQWWAEVAPFPHFN